VETILGLMVGICLSTACGFRVFVPMLGVSIAALSGNITLSPGFQWMGTWPALVAFATATVVEIGAYYIPWVDNAMDTLMTPAAIVAGTILTASMVKDLSPFLKWSLAIIAGGGVAALVQVGTTALRGGSLGITGGLANPLLSTIELIGAVVVTILAVLLPLLCLAAVIWICYKMIRAIGKWVLTKKRKNDAGTLTQSRS
jgi:hypothetical protein